MAKSRPHSFAPRSKPGSGARFKKCVQHVSHQKGTKDAKAICANAGRHKYGKARFQQMAAAGRKRGHH